MAARCTLGSVGFEIPIGGKQMATVRDQAERISRCRLSFQIKQGTRTGLVNQHILDTSMFIEDETEQGGLFRRKGGHSSQSFFDELKKHPVPVEEAAVRQIAKHSMALDVYCWLAYRPAQPECTNHCVTGRPCTASLGELWPGWTISRSISDLSSPSPLASTRMLMWKRHRPALA